MKINIQPIQDNTQSCYEILISSFAKWLGKDYELMFANYWGFKFYHELYEDGKHSLGECFDPQIGKCEEAIEKYHGIKISRVKSNVDLFNVVLSELAKGFPVCIKIDKFFCPWSNTFQKLHDKHFCLIFDVKKQAEEFICLDPFFQVNQGKLSFENFKSGCKGISTFEAVKDFNPIQNWKDIINISLNRLKNKNGIIDIYDDMQSFADAVEDSLDVNKEIAGYKQIWLSPFFLKLRSVSRSRFLFGQALKYLGDHYNENLYSYSDEMIRLGAQIKTIHAMLLKKCYEPDNDKIICDASTRLRAVIEQEKNFAEKLEAEVERRNTKTSVSNQDTGDEHKIIRNEMQLDLHKFLNNKAIKSQNNCCDPSLSETGHYFIMDDQTDNSGKYLSGNSLSSTNTFDNISCEEQIISLPNIKLIAMELTGCADIRHILNFANINMEDKSKESIKIDFPHWAFPNDNQNSSIVWKGKGAKKIEDGTEFILKKSAHIYTIYKELKLNKRAINIELPFCPNIHLFDIKLYY